MINHRFQHLCRGDNVLALRIRHLDHLLLEHRHFLHRNLHTHIAAGNHNAVRGLQNLLQILDSLHVLDLGNNLHVASMLLKNFSELVNIFLTPYKGCGDKLIALLDAKQNILHIRVADIRHGEDRTRYIYTLMIRYEASVDDTADNVLSADFLHLQLDQSVVNQKSGSHRNIIFKVLIGNGRSLCRSHNFLCRQGKSLPRPKLYLTALKIPQTDFRSLCIQHSRNRQPKLLANL